MFTLCASPGYDINLLRQEAHARWLKPSEVLFILQNYESFKIDSEPPQKPPSGSLFLFNRRVLRFFRKDGHAWRRKKDGRAVGEAHEKLKDGDSEGGSSKERAYEHIVLVHYREVAEGRYTGSISNLSPEPNATVDRTTISSNTQSQGLTTGNNEFCEPYHSSCSSSPVEDAISKADERNDSTDGSGKYNSSTRQALKKLAEQLSLEDDDYIHLEKNHPDYPVMNENLQLSSNVGGYVHDSGAGKQVGYADFQSLDVSGNHRMEQTLYLGTSYGFERKESPSWKDMLELSSSSGGSDDYRRTNFLGFNDTPELEAPAKDMLTNGTNTMLFSAERNEGPTISFEELSVLQNSEDTSNGHQLDESELRVQLSASRRYLLGSNNYNESPSSNSLQVRTDDLMLQGNPRTNWMASIPLAVENNTYSTENNIYSTENNIYSTDLRSWFDHYQFNSSLGLDSSLTPVQNQQFSISEISPEWAYCSERTKVIIVGKFLCDPSECSWAAMFGDVEVPIEIVQGGVLRCKAPQHSAGKVTLCVTSANRESCSELREFEFRERPTTAFSTGTSPSMNNAKIAEEQLLLAKFVQLLISQNDSSTTECFGRLNASDDQWQQLIDALESGCENPLGTVDWIIEELLKDKLFSWLSSKSVLSKQEQGIIHLISGLGYEWALNPIINAGVGINFRDANGWTPLHWAAHFGRENMVAALLAAGASAGLVTDPTPQDPVGKTPGFIASARGHKGLAGYLSEIALTSHLFSLTIQECEISKVSAEVEADMALESISQRSAQLRGGSEDELTIRDSLAAVRNATQAAARIQAAFRAHSFRKKQEKAGQFIDDYGMTQEEVLAAAKLHRSQKFDKAALSIQKNYRGWKGRKDFLTFRKHVVKIQAHVRGHQVRKKYREILRAVSVIEKIVLRWRRRGSGLRGFRNEPEPEMVEVEEDEEEEDVAKVFRKQKVDEALEEAVSRVLSVVDSPKARQQYCRVLGRYHQAKADSSTPDEATSRLRDDFTIIEDDDFMYSS
ncbi:Calmodulin-binding transcription activator 4 [Ananas comosus]|uniref:Calmodulin-binding transcription activator 4 n=1 Tax=Ananas comosus TaxID=4615 RepID=A0A199VED3_ANACO|nr:Calmodulin-binding transcription activator 4 [Ananas comosus]